MPASNLNTTAAVELRCASCLNDISESKIALLQSLQIQLHLCLRQVTAVDGHLGNARDGEQRILIRGLNQRAQSQLLICRRRIRQREGVLENCAEGRKGWGNVRRTGRRRQLGAELLQTFRHQLPGVLQLRCVTKHHLHHRKTRFGCGTHHIHPRQTIHSSFDGRTDLELNLLRCKTRSSRLNLHLRRRKGGKHIQRHLNNIQNAPNTDQNRANNNETTACNRTTQDGIEQLGQH